jgi:hypothetical protein
VIFLLSLQLRVVLPFIQLLVLLSLFYLQRPFATINLHKHTLLLCLKVFLYLHFLFIAEFNYAVNNMLCLPMNSFYFNEKPSYHWAMWSTGHGCDNMYRISITSSPSFLNCYYRDKFTVHFS